MSATDTRVKCFIIKSDGTVVGKFDSISFREFFAQAGIGQTVRIDLQESGRTQKTVGNFTIEGPATTQPECPPGQHKDPVTGLCVPDVTTGLKYDSNVQGKMNNGVARFVKDREGNVSANGFGFTVNASGGGGINCLGNGQFNIEPATQGNRRMYVACCNYNARLEGEFAFLDSKPRNLSIKGRNRHQYRDEVDPNAPDSKTQGGLGFHIDIDAQECGGKVEVVHGGNEIDSWSSKLPKPLVVGKWYGFKISYKDRSSTEIDEKIELDYKDGQGFKTVGTHISKPPSQFFNKSDFDTWSQFWLRDNNEGKIGLRNVKLYSI